MIIDDILSLHNCKDEKRKNLLISMLSVRDDKFND